MTPITIYQFKNNRIEHTMDLSTDKIHVKLLENGEEKELFTFDSSCYFRDHEGKLLGKIYLEDDYWVYKNNQNTVTIKGFSFNDVNGVLKTEVLVVASQLGATLEELQELRSKPPRIN